jgi:hypothetical protein
MMKLTQGLAGLVVAVACFTGSATAQDVSLSYGEPAYRGSGCPDGSVALGTSPTAFTLLYDSFIAEDSDGVRARERTKVCAIRVPVSVPAGYQISIDSVDHRGYVSLTEKAWGYLKTQFRVKGKAWHNFGTSKRDYFVGPLDEDYFRRDEVKRSNRQWSPCGGTFYFDIYTHMHVDAKRYNQALLTLDSSDAAMSTRYGIDVRKCRK